MDDLGEPRAAGSPFGVAVGALRGAGVRREIAIVEVGAPRRLAPDALAVSAEVLPLGATPDDDALATGRFVLLHDPASPGAWRGPWRVVTYARAHLDPAMADDPLLADIGWTWLRESLARRVGGWDALGGTVTRVVDQRFGELDDSAQGGPGTSVELEVRASWSPTDGPQAAGGHLQAWADLLGELAGLPPLPDGVSVLPSARW